MFDRIIGKITFWKIFFFGLLLLGFFVAGVRFLQGLGASTNLSDSFPWGLWIGFDLLVGVGLAAGGFVVAATVHIFHMEKYKPIAHPTILTAFLGYLMVIVALLFDLGQPWRIWHAIIMWNPHSVMFEVAWCVMLYTTVLALEFSPMLFERLGWKIPLKLVRMIYVPLVVAGVLLSTMHQSSLGTLYVIAPDKLHGLWYSSMLPVLFFSSAIAGGLAMTIFESYMSKRAFKRGLENDLLRGLARAAVVILGVYFVLRINDLLMRGTLGLAFELSQEAVMFWGEIGLGVILPMVLFGMRKVRHNENGLFLAALLTIMGFVVNRLNVAITGMQRSAGVNYFPHWMEIVVTLTIVAVGFVLFALAVKFLNVFPPEEKLPAPAQPAVQKPIFSGKVVLTFWGLLVIGAALLAFAGGGGETATAEEIVAPEPESELELPEDYVFPMAEESPGEVTFSHESHVFAQEVTDCAGCHRYTFSMHKPGTPLEGDISFERIHEGDLCGHCHNGEGDAFAIDDDTCEDCHSN